MVTGEDIRGGGLAMNGRQGSAGFECPIYRFGPLICVIVLQTAS